MVVPDFSVIGERTVIFGDGESYKSWLALAIALSTATGRELIPGYKPTMTGPAVYLDFEDNALEIRRRAGRLLGNTPIPANFRILGVSGGLHRNLEELRTELAKNPPLVVVVDSVRAANAAHRGQMEDAWAFYGDLIMTAPSPHMSWICVAHVPKDPKNRDKPTGDAGWSNGCRISIRTERMTGDKSRGIVSLHWAKMSNEATPDDRVMTAEFQPGGTVELSIDIGEDLHSRILGAITTLHATSHVAVKKTVARDQVNQRTPKVSEHAFDEVLKHLLEAGAITRTGASSATAYTPATVPDALLGNAE